MPQGPKDGRDAARQAMREVFRDYGPQGLDDEDLLYRLLPDLLAGHRREINLLSTAASLNVGTLLSERMRAGIDRDTAVSDVAAVLADHGGLDADASEWVVSEYADVLGHVPGVAATVMDTPATATDGGVADDRYEQGYQDGYAEGYEDGSQDAGTSLQVSVIWSIVALLFVAGIAVWAFRWGADWSASR